MKSLAHPSFHRSPPMNHSLTQSESGAVMILLAIVLMASLAVVGVAIDSGNLFHSSMLLQKAIDAGALAGAKKIAITGKATQLQDPDAFQAEVEKTVTDMIRENMLIRKTPEQIGDNQPNDPLQYTITLDFKGNTPEDTVEVEAEWNVDLYLLKYLPWYPEKSLVRATTKAQAQRAMVSLQLDTSGSMICPADGSDCGCAPNCPGIRKIDRLKEAVALFAIQFNSYRDMLNIGYFSLTAATGVEMIPTGGFDIKAIEESLLNLTIQGATNQCDALLNGWLDTRDAVQAQLGRKNVAYVLFSDGAPTAARFFFAHPTALPSNDILGLAHSEFDYFNWAADYRDPTDTDLTSPPTLPLKPGVMELAKAGLVPYDWDLGNPPSPANGYPDSTVLCSKKDPLDPSAPFVGCMTDFGFYVPADKSGKVWGSSVPYAKFREQYYNCAIALSDFLRDDGGIVYAIGLGPAAPTSSDPYQIATDDTNRKDYFFSRIANDVKYKKLPQFPNEFKDYQLPKGAEALSNGEYLPLDNAQTLNESFLELYDLIVRKVKTVQLIQ